MKKILLAIDGSAESRFAINICMAIAAKNGSSVTAQHVVDNLAVWNFLSFSLAGLTGSGPYFSAYENICQSLRHLGETLLEAYNLHADSHGIENYTVLDEGDTLSEINKRALGHDLVIVGHRQFSSKANQPGTKNSLCEALAKVCPRPILIVRQPCQLWDSLRIITGKNEIASESIEAILELCNSLAMRPEVYCVKDRSQNWEELVSRLTIHLTPKTLSGIPIQHQTDSTNMEIQDNTLVAIPRVQTKSGSKSAYHSDLDKLIHNMQLPAVLIWPCTEAPQAAVIDNLSGSTIL